ncbi:MAG TPA: SURF1 family protein [Rudaea sp.]|jgi:surfeit locus 1 family protein|nr:SURF1 family protein [Rudaea sp.]
MKRGFLLLFFAVAAAGFIALGLWQLQRRVWKLDLIARVDARVHAPPVAIPPPMQWPAIDAADDEYRHVRLQGRYLNDRATRVDALTEAGAGVWIMTPLITNDGTILINRGFVTREHEHDYDRPDGTVSVTGLLRMTEPGGRFLRANRPLDDAWYSRDVAAIATSRNLGSVAPFFVDADATAPGHYPIGGMTVVNFRNMHLIYALTWFALAGFCVAGVILALRQKPGDERH